MVAATFQIDSTARIPDRRRRPPAPAPRRCACGGIVGAGGECAACRGNRLQRERSQAASPRVDQALRSPGRALDPALRDELQQRFHHDLSQVRVHTDEKAAASAAGVGARAYTVGRHVAFGAGQYAPGTRRGRELVTHEIVHTIQQGASHVSRPVAVGSADTSAEREADRLTAGRDRPGPVAQQVAPGTLQRQLITPLAPGGGFGGLMERDRLRTGATSAGGTPGPAGTPYRVCSRDLQHGLGIIANHAYIEAAPHRYAIIGPLCPASPRDGVIRGTTAQKWDNSPDPCGKAPTCLPCHPRPGITDVGACFRAAFGSYHALSLYKALGPNSNTFAGTLARTCCAGMDPKPRALGNCPGWNDPPAPARAGGTPCPPGPSC